MVQGRINRRPSSMAVPPFDAVADPRKWAIFIDDFIVVQGLDTGMRVPVAAAATATHPVIAVEDQIYGQLGWSVSGASLVATSLTQHTTASIVQGHPGVALVTLASGDDLQLTLPNLDGFVLPDGSGDSIYLMAVLRITSAAMAGTACAFGLSDTTDAYVGSTLPANCILIAQDPDNEDHWVPFLADGSTDVEVNPEAEDEVDAAIGTWFTLEIAAHEDYLAFYANGTFIGDDSTAASIPDDEPLGPYFSFNETDAAAETYALDLFCARLPVERTGYAYNTQSGF